MRSILYLVFAVLFAGCFASETPPSKKNSSPVLPVITLTKVDTILKSNYVAGIQALRNVEIRTKIGGSVDKIFIDEGRFVKKGQPLFQLNPAMFQVDLDRARAKFEDMKAEAHMAELEVERVKLLVDKKVISQSELELAKAKLKSVRAKVKEAQTEEAGAEIKLEFATVRAPFDGITNRIPLKAGSFVSEGQLLTTISDISDVYAYFDVSEIEYLHYIKTREKSGSKYTDVTLQLADGSLYAYPGKIETIEGEIDHSTGSIAFRARFKNPGNILKHGSSGKITLTSNLRKTLLVPQKAVFEVQDKNYVFVVNSDSTITMKSFEPAAKIAESYAVRSGLNAGDNIVYEGIQNIKHGIKIQPQLVSIKSQSMLNDSINIR